MHLKDKIALVTGASRGIGRSIALALAKSGVKVVINYAGNKEAAEEVKAIIEADGGEAVAIRCDVSDAKQVEEMFSGIVNRFGTLDILVNNAGITKDNLLLRMKDEDWDAVFNTNLKGVFNCTKSAAKLMMKKRSGKIINMTSVIGIIGNAGQSNYAAAKAGVIGFTKSMAKELASRGINVNAVAPGFIETDMTAVLPDKVKSDMLLSIPLGRLGRGEDIAGMVVFLSSPCSDYITGQVINVDGGMVI